MSNQTELPEPGRMVLALLDFEDMPPMPVVGFMADTIDTNEPYFHCPGNRRGYHRTWWQSGNTSKTSPRILR